MENVGKPKYGILENGAFGLRVISGIVTGVRFTEDKPVYEISFGKDKWWTSEITDSVDEIVGAIALVPLQRVKETHGLKIKYNQ